MFTFNKSSYKTFRQLQHAIIHVLQKHSTRETVQNTLSNSSIKRRLDFFYILKYRVFHYTQKCEVRFFLGLSGEQMKLKNVTS